MRWYEGLCLMVFIKNHTIGKARLYNYISVDFIVAADPIFQSMTRIRAGNVTKMLQNLNIACKVLFSGVFDTTSISPDGGIVMDENGRNGWNWHLAQQFTYLVMSYRLQQITYHVTLYIFQQLAQHVIMRILSMTIFQQ